MSDEVQQDLVDNSHLVYDSSKHSAELIMTGSPPKEDQRKDSPSIEDRETNGTSELKGPTEVPATEATQATQG